VTLEDVLARMPAKRRPTLKRRLRPRWAEIMDGLEARKWASMEEARKALRLGYRGIYLIRSALRLAGVMAWDSPFSLARDAKPTPTQQRLFTMTKEGFRYAQ
jgi:hypothetical protein